MGLQEAHSLYISLTIEGMVWKEALRMITRACSGK